ncbi:MAG: hypothetical protein RBU23_04875 [Candidatus Auribacterota bacterium]|jgi:hypothetical protein|nr:hypothetical protein [Candidatus Auribacterota bacterium]
MKKSILMSMFWYVSRGQVDRELGTWDTAMLESIYNNGDPPPVPEPSAVLMCLLGLCFKPLFGKRSAK